MVVGANGTGKSTLFDVFSFLKDSLTQNVQAAAAKRGGFKELRTRNATDPIRIELKFREKGGRIATYDLSLVEKDGRVVVAREVLKFRRGKHGQPWHFVDFKFGSGSAITNETVYGGKNVEEDRADHSLDDASTLAIKGLGQFKEFRIVSEFRSLIENWHVSDFHIADARQSAEAGYAEHLSPVGDNVAQVAQYLFENHRTEFDRVLEAMKARVPGVTDVQAMLTADGRLVLRFQDGSFTDPFIARYVSDGTIKMFAYLLLLYDPAPHPLLAVEEPENQLYPKLMQGLVEEFRSYAKRGGQVFVSTHSPEFLNGTTLDEIFWLVKREGCTEIRRASDDEQLRAFYEAGDLPGALWRQGLFEGSHPHLC
ncbi:MAG: AAA family ATPase [Fimbriimonadaceae bacterium]|nr:AAA family ATPase [Fimbriimonadaceae bacterium]